MVTMNHSFISSHPPLIVFTLCLTAFGFTMIVLAYIVGEQEVPNPDVQMDWNNFFEKMSDLKLCSMNNFTKNAKENLNADVSLHSESSLNSSTSHVVDQSKSMSAVLSNVVDSALVGGTPEPTFIEISVQVKFKISGKLPSKSYFVLKGRLKGKLLGFPGKYSHTVFNVSLGFKSLESICIKENCISTFKVCVTMSLPLEILPKLKSPATCKNVHARNNWPIIFSEVSDLKSSTTNCIELNYSPDAKLTEMLSPQDRSIVNLHLMHTSYFMFVMVVTLICFSLIRGRYRQPKNYVFLQKISQEG